MNYSEISYLFMQSIAILDPREFKNGRSWEYEIEEDNINKLLSFNFEKQAETNIRVYEDQATGYNQGTTVFIQISGDSFQYTCTVWTIIDLWKKLRKVIGKKVWGKVDTVKPEVLTVNEKTELKRVIIENFGSHRYWKHSIAMKLSYKVKSLKKAWQIVKDIVSELPAVKYINSLKESMFVALMNELRSTGKIFHAQFIKKDKTVRDITCRFGVKKGLNGKGMSWDPVKKGLLPVYEIGKDQYRMINMNTLQTIKHKGITYSFEKTA